ncbi:MAG: hypothetical protein HY429_04075 [Candidatus Levybacteria bacterium]|nr:hypothetical protein [Candidatus Levybacteria bacterium]
MKKGERIGLFNPDGKFSTGISFLRYVGEVGSLHIQSREALAKKGVRWYMVGSLLVPLFGKLSDKSIPAYAYPAISYLWEYARFFDDLIDNANSFPNWSETKQAIGPSQSRLVKAVSDFRISPEQKREVLYELADLRRRSYAAFERQHGWTETASFADAFAYRKDSSLLLMRKVAAMGNILASTNQSVRTRVEDGFEAIGIVALQLPDDLQDVLDDKITDGNLVHATLHDHGEFENFFNAAQNSPDGTNLFGLLANTAPYSTHFLTSVANAALSDLRAVSPDVERAIYFASQLLFDHIVIDRGKNRFMSKFTRGD